MAKAVADCAFITSKLPVVLSMEMHCSAQNQNRLAHSMVDSMGADLVSVRYNSSCRSRTRFCVLHHATAS